jgi:WS/DGAT/MGAT family acyltransferase
MQQLSGQDAAFLYAETPTTPNHVAGVYIYDQSTAPGGLVTFKGILAYLQERLQLARTFRERVVRVPLDLDHPYWIEDECFDLEFHVRHIALPKPGNWRQLCIQAARLHARPLDLNRPLWEMTVVEGLDDVEGLPRGCFAIVWKTHHAAIDGVSGIEIINAVHAAPPSTPDTWRPEPVPPPLPLLARAGIHAMTNPLRASQTMARMVPGLPTMARQIGPGQARLASVPRTRFNGPVTGHRVFDGRSFPLPQAKRIKSALPGATVNDAALAAVGGALRLYLLEKGELPDRPLLAMIPISVRTEEERTAAGNRVSMMTASLATNVDDPLERLKAVTASTHESKLFANAVGARNLTELSQYVPGLLIGLGSRALGSRILGRVPVRLPFNTTVTNVPGSQVPLYFAGARMVASYGMGPVVHGMGLINIISSYDGSFIFSFTACREMMPDPAFYAACFEDSFLELVQVTG